MEQQEQVEWDDVNKLLQYHGFKPVCFADPVENKNLSDLVLLGKASAGEIRATLRTMLTDSERRQALIQELIKSNKELKEEAQQQMRAAAHQSQRATELQTLLDQVRVQVQELEERHLDKVLQHGSRMQQLQQEKEEEQKRSEELQLKLWREKEKSAELQRKLYFTIKEEEERRSESSQLHTERRSRHNSAAAAAAADQELSDVMMVYEAEVTRLKDELRSIRGETDPRPTQRTTNSAASSFHTALKVYEQQQRESRGQIEELQKEVEQLKQELLHTQTTVKEAKLNKHPVCCGVDGLKRRSKTRSSREDQLCAHYHNLLTEVSAMVMNPPGAPSGPRCRQRPAAVAPDVTGFDDVMPRLEVWSQQLHLLKELQRGLRRLAARMFPGQLCDGVHDDAGGVKVEDMVLLVDTMLEDISAAAAAAEDDKVLRSPTKFTLASMVSHFQKLFDVSSLSGVFPRMNEVYSCLGETSTAMKNLRDLLHLDSRASAAQVVQQASQLVSSRSKVDELLGDADIDSIIVKVKQHDEFFTPFQMLMMDMFLILGVSRLDDVLPAVRTCLVSV